MNASSKKDIDLSVEELSMILILWSFCFCFNFVGIATYGDIVFPVAAGCVIAALWIYSREKHRPVVRWFLAILLICLAPKYQFGAITGLTFASLLLLQKTRAGEYVPFRKAPSGDA